MTRRCIDCRQALPAGKVHFDQNHNVLCPHCGGVVLAAEVVKERVDKKVAAPNYHTPPHHQRSGYYDPDEEFQYRSMSDQ